MKVYAIKNDKGQYWAVHSNFWARMEWTNYLERASFYPEKEQADGWCKTIQKYNQEKCVVVEICVKEKINENIC